MPETFYAPAERDSISDIIRMYNTIRSVSMIHELMEKLDQDIFILNSYRQTVYINKAALQRYSIPSPEAVLGKRPGEIFDCQYASAGGGCGTSKFCKDCGAVNAILKTQLQGSEAIEECVICSREGQTYELAVTSRPFMLKGREYTVFSVSDIGLKRRMEVLEKIFFHDIINIAGGIHSMLKLMQDETLEDKAKINELLVNSSAQLLNELNTHKLLKAAEINDLIVQQTMADSLKLLDDCISFSENMKAAFGKILYLDSSSDSFELKTDETLLKRVLLNMITNALESSDVGGKVTAGVNLRNGRAVFWVQNDQIIPEEIRHKIFMKSFTTKKRGSGLGTHSIKTLTEKYLNGSVAFETGESKGTVFRVTLPLE
ncbi:MAG: ATP-binding protein [Deferribacterales bacterium]